MNEFLFFCRFRPFWPRMERNVSSPLMASDEDRSESCDPMIIKEEDSDSMSTTSSPTVQDEELGQQYEEILERIGGFGYYQKCIVGFVLLPMFFASAFMSSSWVSPTVIPVFFYGDALLTFTVFSQWNMKIK